MKERKVILILLALWVFLLCGCSGTATTVSDQEKIEATIENCFKALFSSDLEEARSYLVPGGPLDTRLNSLYEQGAELIEPLAPCEITADTELISVEINGNRAEAVLSSIEICATCPGQAEPSCFPFRPSQGDATFQLEKHDGKWLIYDVI
ncbi:MAG: hypothetical protein H5U36_01100 [Candidatus Caldatribacterium sp.]|nr:hypothetical protein [Candidatus Caldatribacterium sp.]